LKLAALAQRVSHPIWQYALAVASVAVALGITGVLEPRTTLRTPLFYIAIIISGWFGGMGPGLLSVVLSTLAIGYYFAPGQQPPVSNLDSRPFLLLFSLSGLIACWISVQRRRAEQALKRVRDELERRVEERTADLRRASEGLRAEIAERKRGEDVLRERADLLDLTSTTSLRSGIAVPRRCTGGEERRQSGNSLTTLCRQSSLCRWKRSCKS